MVNVPQTSFKMSEQMKVKEKKNVIKCQTMILKKEKFLNNLKEIKVKRINKTNQIKKRLETKKVNLV